MGYRWLCKHGAWLREFDLEWRAKGGLVGRVPVEVRMGFTDGMQTAAAEVFPKVPRGVPARPRSRRQPAFRLQRDCCHRVLQGCHRVLQGCHQRFWSLQHDSSSCCPSRHSSRTPQSEESRLQFCSWTSKWFQSLYGHNSRHRCPNHFSPPTGFSA